MFPILNAGPLAIPLAPILLLLGFFVSASLVEAEAARLGLDRTSVSNLIYIALAAALVGARLGYVLTHLDAFLQDPLSIIVPAAATLDPLWGLAIGVLAGGVFGKRYGLPLWRTLDALAPGIAAMSIFLGVAHLASGDAFGAPAALPWSIFLWDELRHPSQVYEILAAALVFGVWWRVRALPSFDGFRFWTVIALLALGVTFLEAFRGDSLLYAGWRVAQVIALAVLALSLVALRLLSRLTPLRDP